MPTHVRRPELRVTINGTATPVLSASTQHSVDAPVAQASLVLPLPLPGQVLEDAPVKIEARGDAGEAWEPLFVGRLRGPIERGLAESEATATVRCDGNLWRAGFPMMFDFTWVGPITPRKIIRALLTLLGVKPFRVEEFVHPATGVPILIGGVPWFDEGRVVLPAGTTPLAFMDRLCRLFGYRIYDRPDGEVRVSRVCGPPPEGDYHLVEGVDWLNVSRSIDLHEVVNHWEAIGASGTDLAGQQVAVVSRPVRGVRSRFIPNPPKYSGGTVSDPLLTDRWVAEAARIVREYDQGGPSWRVRGEVVGASRRVTGLAPRQALRVTAPTLRVNEPRDFWLTAVSTEFSERGYWTEVEGWLPTGKPARTAPPEEPDPEEPETGSDDPVPDVPDAEWDAGEPLPETGVPDEFGDYAPPEDPELPGWEDPALDAPEEHPGGFLPCGPAPVAPARACATVSVLGAGWDTAVDPEAGLALPFVAPAAADAVAVAGEALGGGTVAVWQGGVLVGSAAIPAGAPGEWTAFSVAVPGTVAAGPAELRFAAAGGA